MCQISCHYKEHANRSQKMAWTDMWFKKFILAPLHCVPPACHLTPYRGGITQGLSHINNKRILIAEMQCGQELVRDWTGCPISSTQPWVNARKYFCRLSTSKMFHIPTLRVQGEFIKQGKTQPFRNYRNFGRATAWEKVSLRLTSFCAEVYKMSLQFFSLARKRPSIMNILHK